MHSTLQTERLNLRPFTLDYARKVQNLAGDSNVARTTLHIPHPYEDGMAEKWIETLIEGRKEHKQYAYAIEIKETNEFIGTGTIIPNSAHRTAELAYWIGFNYWNRGYASEAAKRLIEEAFSELSIIKIFAAHLDTNPASGRVMEKLGMQREGVLRQHVLKWNNQCDLVYYGLLRGELP